MPSTAGRSSQLRRLRLGMLVAVPVALLAVPFGGWTAARAALVFGVVATALQLLAARLARRAGVPATPDHLVVYGIGMALRVAGVGLIWLAVTIDRAAFPPGAAALGYLGTLLPLLWLETRLT
ncbi:MAG: hypothetical protein H6692_01755 [Gemmatimonadales bacterium]|nr:hypothetical protein [Gemmatimonadales bacterium]